jgi:hypothetical protein
VPDVEEEAPPEEGEPKKADDKLLPDKVPLPFASIGAMHSFSFAYVKKIWTDFTQSCLQNSNWENFQLIEGKWVRESC